MMVLTTSTSTPSALGVAVAVRNRLTAGVSCVSLWILAKWVERIAGLMPGWKSRGRLPLEECGRG